MAIPATRRSTRLLVYSHDAFGLGNIRRTLKICDQLAKEIPDLSILLMTGSSMVHSFRLSPKMDYVKLPCVHRQARNKYVSKYLRTSFKEISDMREELIHAAFRGFRPHIVLVDKVPTGIKGELLRSIEWLKATQPGSKVILGLRDILDDPEHVRKLWEHKNYYETLDKFYDSIWVFGSPKIYDMVAEYGFPENIARKLNYCGYIMQSPALRSKDEVKRELGITSGKFVLVTAGGGGDGYNLMKTYLKSLKPLAARVNGDPDNAIHSVMVLGPDMPLHKKERLLQRTGATPGTQESDAISIQERREITLEAVPGSPSHELRLTLTYLEGSGWTPETIIAAVKESARILGQCGLALRAADLIRITAPIRFHDFFTPGSRELAATLKLNKPTVYFVAGTRQQPSFDAEAIGRGNSRTRPELRDTVWVTRGTRDLGMAVAHELAHVLMDSGEHSDEPDNLMRDETAPGNLRLSAPQCARMRDTGIANGLLKQN